MGISKTIPPQLFQFFMKHKKIALAFSGGVDSAYLMYAASLCKCDVKAYYIKSEFQPAFELEHAKKLSQQLGVPMTIITLDVLAQQIIVDNPNNRCYYCKNAIFGTLLEATKKDGYTQLMDGTNATDNQDDRPGMKALEELQVLSPLRICGITKAEIREYSKIAELFTWNKPAYACLATRIVSGQVITSKTLADIECCENFLFQLGYSDFRIRVVGNTAKIQLKNDQLDKFIKEKDVIYKALNKGFEEVVLDLKNR